MLLSFGRQLKKRITKVADSLEYIETRLEVRNKTLRQQEARLRLLINDAAGELNQHRQTLRLAKDELGDIVKNHETYRVEIERLQAQLQIAEEIVIPELTAAVKNAQARWETETAIQTRRQFPIQSGEE